MEKEETKKESTMMEFVSHYYQVIAAGSYEGGENIVFPAGEGKTVVAPAVEGKNFLYWTDGTGLVLGYDKAYFQQVGKDMVVKAVYGTKKEGKQPVEAMTRVYDAATTEKNRIAFSVTRDVPEGYTLTEHGVIANRTGFGNPDGDNFVLGAEGVTKFRAVDNSAAGAYTLNVNMTGAEDTRVVARGYLVVKNNSNGNEEVYDTKVTECSYLEIQNKNQ